MLNFALRGTPALQTAQNQKLFRFGPFEADARQGELRKRGIRLRLQEQPFQILIMLLEDAGKLITREELRQRLWPNDTFVDFDHSVNTAINKIRDILGDSAAAPLFVETIPKRGYRFIAAVETVTTISGVAEKGASAVHSNGTVFAPSAREDLEQLPAASRQLTRGLFALIQVMYLIFYIAALAHLERIREIAETFSPAGAHFFTLLLMLSAILAIPMRLYLLSSVSFDYRGLGVKYARLFPALLPLDEFWALAPFLMVPKVGIGLAFAATAGLLYLPFSQRTLIRMSYPLQRNATAPANKVDASRNLF